MLLIMKLKKLWQIVQFYRRREFTVLIHILCCFVFNKISFQWGMTDLWLQGVTFWDVALMQVSRGAQLALSFPSP